MSEIVEKKSLKKNINRIVKAFEKSGFKNIKFFKDRLFEGHTRIYADYNREFSMCMTAGGEGHPVAINAIVLVGPGDFPRVDPPYREDGNAAYGGTPEFLIELALRRLPE
ncbi:MAG: hypothetical protein PHI49_06655 [Halothiobacillaceae bacterium]|nr:hypothetical protein [Halothiobacillaceae bacterium]